MDAERRANGMKQALLIARYGHAARCSIMARILVVNVVKLKGRAPQAILAWLCSSSNLRHSGRGLGPHVAHAYRYLDLEDANAGATPPNSWRDMSF